MDRYRDPRTSAPACCTPILPSSFAWHSRRSTWRDFFFQAEDGIRDWSVTGVQTCALPILGGGVDKHYFNLYPSAHISWKPGYSTEFQLSYSRRVDRPTAKDLNPFPEFRDARTVYAGKIGRASCRERV